MCVCSATELLNSPWAAEKQAEGLASKPDSWVVPWTHTVERTKSSDGLMHAMAHASPHSLDVKNSEFCLSKFGIRGLYHHAQPSLYYFL